MNPAGTVVCGFWPHATAEVARRLGPDVVVAPDGAEPDRLRAGSAPYVVAAVAGDLLFDGLTDERVGELIARQIEQADAVVPVDLPDDEWDAEQIRVLLQRIAPWSMKGAPLTRGLRGLPIGVHDPVPDHGVVSCVFRARRPFHPVRLHDALDRITENVLRSRGHFWLASRPDLVMTWESAGGLGLGPACGWLAELPLEHWDDVDPERRLAADIDWDPYYGDRHHHLAFVGIDLDPARVHRTLTGCLLSDDELSRGEEHWRRLPDPFIRAYLPGGIA